MSRGSKRPPAFVRLLLHVLLPRSEREFYLGDMEESGARPWIREVIGAVGLRFARSSTGKPRTRPPRAGTSWRPFFSDFRHGLRRWVRTPSPAVTVLIAMSIGIGMSTLMFSLISGVLLPTLPFPAGDRIVRIHRVEHAPLTAESLDYLRARQGSFESLAAWVEPIVNLGIDAARAEPVQAAAMEVGAFELLPARPVLGRGFTPLDARPGAPAVVLVGHATWQTGFGGDPGVLGRTVRVNGEPAEVIGVMPEGFGFPRHQELWMPLRLDVLRPTSDEPGRLGLFGILREGVSIDAAISELNVLDRQRPRPVAEAQQPMLEIARYTDIINPRGRSELLGAVMLGVALLVLLVACANATNVLLAQAAVRGREVAVRTALGASRFRIAMQFWVEVSVLAIAGAAGGVALAAIGLRVIRNAMPQGGMMPYWFAFRIDLPVLLFVAVATVIATMLAGVVPALHASRSNGHELLKDSSRGSSSHRLGRTMARLIVVEMAVSFVLLVAAGLFVRSVANISRYHFPFEPEGVFTSALRLPDGRYANAEDRVAAIDRLDRSLAAIPGVSSVALATSLPGVGSPRTPVAVEGVQLPGDAVLPDTRYSAVTPDFFRTFLATPLSGRTFLVSDRRDALAVAIVNRAFEQRHLPDGAVGRRIALPSTAIEVTWLTVVGVVPDLFAGGLDRELDEAVYRPIAQAAPLSFHIAIRSGGGAAALTPLVRDAVADADPDAALFMMTMLDDSIDASHSQYTWFTALFLIAGAFALFLGAIGLYGVMAFWVAQRTREIGVRLALGSGRTAIVRIVLRQGMLPIAVGLLAGMVFAAPLAWALRAVLIDVRPFDPFVFVLVPGVMFAAGWLGCALPAARATRVDPHTALASD